MKHTMNNPILPGSCPDQRIGQLEENYYLAIDIGASSGRHILGHVEDGKILLEEVYRFDNKQLHKDGHDCWDMDNLWNGILGGLRACRELGKVPKTIGIDTWAVDFVLLDEQDRLIRHQHQSGQRQGKGVGLELIQHLGLPAELFGELSMPGTVVGELTAEIQKEVGFNATVILPATHDTGSTFLAVPAVDENAAYLSSGTWSLLGVETPNSSPRSKAGCKT